MPSVGILVLIAFLSAFGLLGYTETKNHINTHDKTQISTLHDAVILDYLVILEIASKNDAEWNNLCHTWKTLRYSGLGAKNAAQTLHKIYEPRTGQPRNSDLKPYSDTFILYQKSPRAMKELGKLFTESCNL